MKKIPTLFQRDPDDMHHILPEVNPGCEWVMAGEGVPTRKYDGTCVMFDGDNWWARREVKPNKPTPEGFIGADHDIVTGKTVGWEPVEQSPFRKMHAEAVANDTSWPSGTYELIGPKINSNPEGQPTHTLIAHDAAEVQHVPVLTFDRLRECVLTLYAAFGVEGIVWHHPDGRMAKLKARDFPRD